MKSKSPGSLPPLEKGMLYGYSTKLPTRARQQLLRSLIEDNVATYRTVIGRLNLVRVYNRKNDFVWDTVSNDMAYLQKRFPPQSPFRKSPQKSSPRKRLSKKKDAF